MAVFVSTVLLLIKRQRRSKEKADATELMGHPHGSADKGVHELFAHKGMHEMNAQSDGDPQELMGHPHSIAHQRVYEVP